MTDNWRPEATAAVSARVAAGLKKEQDRLLAWMRRHTSLSDDQILDALRDYSTAAFNAGHEIGFNQAMHKAGWDGRRVRVLNWITFVITAALVASIWFSFAGR